MCVCTYVRMYVYRYNCTQHCWTHRCNKKKKHNKKKINCTSCGHLKCTDLDSCPSSVLADAQCGATVAPVLTALRVVLLSLFFAAISILVLVLESCISLYAEQWRRLRRRILPSPARLFALGTLVLSLLVLATWAAFIAMALLPGAGACRWRPDGNSAPLRTFEAEGLVFNDCTGCVYYGAKAAVTYISVTLTLMCMVCISTMVCHRRRRPPAVSAH